VLQAAGLSATINLRLISALGDQTLRLLGSGPPGLAGCPLAGRHGGGSPLSAPTTGDLPDILVQLIRTCIPTYQAAQTLLFLAANPGRRFAPEDIVASMGPAGVTPPDVAKSAALLRLRGLIIEADGSFGYHPASPEIEMAVAELQRAYNERPVTLINTIYRANSPKPFIDEVRVLE
jgi:hypothetical protein